MPFNVQVIATLVKMAVAVGYIMLTVPMLIWLERKVLADFQARVGPDRVGPYGTLQGFVDGIKLVLKESVLPAEVDRLLYMAAPVIVLIPAISVAAVVPWGAPLRINGYPPMQMVIADLPIGLLFVVALTSLSVYGIVLSGWASNNKYSLLGGLRSSAQMVAYELPMGLSLLAGLMIVSYNSHTGLMDLSLSRVVDAQGGGLLNWTAFNWRFPLLGLLALVCYYIAGVAETNRAPFDLPEAESELIGGYHTEYGGLRWAMFFLGEYAAMLNVSAVAVTVFLGGWHAPYPDALFLPEFSIAYMLQGIFWFGVKVFAIIMFYIHLRASFPRLRYDRLMGFTWKALLPVTLANLMVVASILTVAFPSQAPAELLDRPGSPPGPGAGLPGIPPAGNLPALNGPAGNAPAGNIPQGAGGPPPGGNAPPGNQPASAPAGNSPVGNAPTANSPAAAPAENSPAPAGNSPSANAPAGGTRR